MTSPDSTCGRRIEAFESTRIMQAQGGAGGYASIAETR
jgi:hypothetical protein